MAQREHSYALTVRWTGNRGSGTSGYAAFGREHEVLAPGKPVLAGTADPAFRGDPARWNPEELLVAALSQCHMLWYLALCANAKVVVTDYVDEVAGTMAEHAGGGGEFTEVVLRPTVTVAEAGMIAKAGELHTPAHEKCFIARSVNFAVKHEPTILVAS